MNQEQLYDRLIELGAQGEIVPDRSLLKTPEQIEAIKKSAALNTAILDHVAKHICAGMSTADITKALFMVPVIYASITFLSGFIADKAGRKVTITLFSATCVAG